MKKTAFIIVVIVLIVGFLVFSRGGEERTAPGEEVPAAETPVTNPPAAPSSGVKPQRPPPTSLPAPQKPSAVEIRITASGFAPANVTVPQGTTVRFVNEDTVSHWPASAPHPAHTDLSGFDAGGELAKGEFYEFTFEKLGTWRYHDHANTSLRGSVTVTGQ